MVNVAVLGVGNRGYEYSLFVKNFHKKRAQLVALCDSNPIRLTEAAKALKVPDENCYKSDEEFFAAGKLADVLFVCTQDRSHYPHAMRALDLGYHVLSEKPLSPVLDHCYDLQQKARDKGLHLVVCHVLRYSNHYKKIKEILRSGELGEVVRINHTENVAYFHFAHSYVRGNWHREDETSPSLLAKCCHDIDLLQWFMERPCQSVSSRGDIAYFNSSNAPKGAALRCLDGCKAKDTCPYDAERLYIKDPFYRATFIKYMGRTLTHKMRSTKAEKYKAIREGDYGKCVYFCNNDVMDHQEVLMDFGEGRRVLHNMYGLTDKMFRKTHIVCEKGEIISQDNKGKITVNIFGGKRKKVRTRWITAGGHIEGDIRLIATFLKFLNGETVKTEDMTFIDATIPSHEIIAVAEESRKQGGLPLPL